MSRLLLCTDLDRTLLPNGPQVESPHAREYFTRLVEQQHITLAYVTGRDKNLVLEAIDEFQLPEPDFVIADVGSTIYEITNHRWSHLNSWQQEISTDWNNFDRYQLIELLSVFEVLSLQEESKQNTYKLSYYVSLDVDNVVLANDIQSLLRRNNVQANIIWSIDELKSIGLLDILPVSANKRHAIEFIMRHKNFTHAETIFAGDSGNDIDVLTSPVNSVLVANASDDVKAMALKQAEENNNLSNIYIAQGYKQEEDMNGNYSAGILEGIIHYLPEMKSKMEFLQ